MARSTQEIQQEIITAVQVDPVLSTRLTGNSNASIWRLWSHIVANIISIAENIMDNDKSTIQSLIASNRIGTGPWYVALAKQFQWSDNETYFLVVNPVTGAVSYNKTVHENRIVTQAAYVENPGKIIIKVASGTPGALQQLTMLQQLALENYLRSMKIAGIIVEVVNLPADMLEMDCDVYYSASYDAGQMKDAITEELDRYSMTLNYNGVIYRTDVITAIKGVPGVVDVAVNGIYGLQGNNREEITRVYTTFSGYFNIKKTDGFPKINLIAE